MRIGVDATCWAHRRGYGRFARELLPPLASAAPADTFVCFADPTSADVFDCGAPNVRLVRVAQSAAPVDAASADGSRSPADMLRLTRAVAGEPLDVFFSPSVYTYFPLPPRLRALVTIHDAIAERFPTLTLPSRRARLFWTAKVRLALLQARLVLTVSQYSAREIAAVLGVSPALVRVAVEAPSPAYHPPTAEEAAAAAREAGLPDGSRYLIYVGGFSPHKRVDAIARAHAALARELGTAAPHLVLVGPTSGDAFLGDQPAIRRAIAEGGAEPLVHWTGFLPDETLRRLHGGAIALLLPSLAEGFGLPAVEAAACGTPVIATTASPLPELLAGGGLFVAPGDDAALLDAMRRMATDEAGRRAMGVQACRRAGMLTWERAAEATLAALREAAA